MAIYTFRPDQIGEASQLMRFANLPCDSSAKSHARMVLDLYPRFGQVQIWDGERLVDSIARRAPIDDCVA